MAEHYTRNTVGIKTYCRKCGKDTMHRVDSGRKGPCEACIERLEQKNAEARKVPPPAKQESLF